MLEQTQTYEQASFWAQNGQIALNKNFFRKTITVILIYLLVSLILGNFKKILRTDHELGSHTIFGPKMTQLP